MKKWIATGACVLSIMSLTTSAAADDLRDATEILCSSAWAMACAADQVCETGLPAAWNIPQFVVADLKAKTLSTTMASSESRTTPIELVRTENGLVFIQGTELDRAFSMVISETTGSLSGSITTENLVITVFGACTPMATGR